ncbi:MAG: glycosyltransferase family 4 protein [Deltaproteobacteria bacterium]|uniref:Glycosyltransferase family 4 protein n=1 Tax=Candidatus Zymogenus saltonus TaxID=2844893 RepID=A0A9D8KF31_9DELT|nr:glycosyltransferase family 4 protein [Candidatus Zymogenus saltonus]
MAHRILHIQKITGISGSENHLVDLMSNLDRNRFEPTFLGLVEPNNRVDDYFDILESRSVQGERIVIRSHLDLSCLMEIVRFIKGGSFDIVHTHLIHGDIYGIMAAVMARAPHIISSKHGYDNYDKTSHFYKINGLFSFFVKRVITISDALQDKVNKSDMIPKKKMVTVHYGLDWEGYLKRSKATGERVRKELNVGEGIFTFASVGRLVDVKGYPYLIEAAARMKREGYKDFTVFIMGDGPLREELTKKAHDMGVGDVVRFLGRREDVSSILSISDAFVLPTLGEGFGLVLLEAMAHRLPVISTSTMSIPEIVVEEETGLLVQPKDPEGLAKAMGRLMKERAESKRMGEAGFERLKEKFTIPEMVRKTEQIYEEVLGI